MKKLILILLLTLTVLSSCKKDSLRNGDACISANKTITTLNEQITISNCGDALPPEHVVTSLDWGDGTETDGQTGTHTYNTAGTYTVRLLLNGEYAADVAEVDENKVKIQITVQ